MTQSDKAPPRVWLMRCYMERLKKPGCQEVSAFSMDTGDGQKHEHDIEYLSLQEHEESLKRAVAEARAEAFEEALGALDSYEKSFAIWPGKISLNEIKGWLLNRKDSGESKEKV